MKSVLSSILFLFACNFVSAQCSIFGPTSPPVNQTNTYSVSSSLAQCGSCYDWDVSGNAQIIGSDMGNSAQIRRTGTGGYSISVTYFSENGCQSCSVNIASLNTPCNFTVAILDSYFLGIGNVGIGANTFPTVGPGASYSWTVTYQNNTTNSATTTNSVAFFPATTANKIVTASVTVTQGGCSASTTKTFLFPIPESSGGFGKVHGGSGLTDPQIGQKFKLYPNPTNSSLQVEGAEMSGYTISIFDVAGKYVVKNAQLGQQLSLETAAPGMYMYVITDENGFRQEGKIVRE